MTDQDDGIPSYLNRLTQARLLSVAEEAELTRAVREGDAEAKRRLIEANMRLVINIAKNYKNRSVPLEDLIQEGAIGLMQAAERYDPNKGFRFSTYATHWIRQAIGRAIDNKARAIRVPAHVSQFLRRVERERQQITRELGAEPTIDQLASAMGVTARKLALLMHSSQELLSLDMTVGDSGASTLGSLLKDDGHNDPEEQAMSRETLLELERILQELNEREQHVMRLRYRLDGSEPQVHDELARELQLSRERVRQIESQAIRKLRAIAEKRRLRDMID